MSIADLRVPGGTVRVARRVVIGAALLLMEGAAQAGSRSLTLGPWERGAIERARTGALVKLERSECQRLLSELRDGRGRTLEDNLAEWAMGPAEYAALVPFLDGSREPLCRRATTAMVATPGVRRVYVCRGFADLQFRQPALAESLVIHEWLHTLGLGENPPTSLEITARVAARCR